MIDHSGFRHHGLSPFDRYLRPRFVGKPTLYLEIGVLAGDSAEWMLRNVLTHPMSWADLVDPWLPGEFLSGGRMLRYTAEQMNGFYKTARKRLEPYCMQCTIHCKTATEFFVQEGSQPQEASKFDLIYIDGNHTYDDVLCDGCHAIKHLHLGGILVFDDTNQEPVMKAVNQICCELYPGWLQPFYSTRWQKAFVIQSFTVRQPLRESTPSA